MLRKKKTRDQTLTPQDYEHLGRDFESLLIKDYIDVLHSTPRQIWSSFVRGLFVGLGGVVGATIGAAALFAILVFLGQHLPIVGPYLQAAGKALQHGR
jgi:hypothetical protein